MPEPANISLRGVAETALITLAVRAAEAARPDALLRDATAVRLAGLLGPELQRTRVWMAEHDKAALILRGLACDRFAREFLNRNPDAAVVHIGCGFDARFERVDNGRVEWFDLDLPPVIAARRQLLGGDSGRHHTLACSALDREWMDALSPLRPRPVLFLAEGVLVYFEEAQVRSLILTLRDRFPGAELVFDAFSPLHVRLTNAFLAFAGLTARCRWGVWRGQEIEGWGDGIRLLDEWGYFDRPEPRLAGVRWMRHIPLAERAGRIYRFRLGDAAGGKTAAAPA